MTDNPLYSRVLIKAPGLYRTFRDANGRTALRYDIGSLSYVLEGLIALSATEVVLTPRGAALAGAGATPAALKDRVVVADPRREVDREVEALLRPIAEELGFTLMGNGVITRAHALAPLDPALRDAFIAFFPALYDLLIAARAQAQADIDLRRFKEALGVLRASCRSSEARTHLAVIEGILNVYRPTQVPSLWLPHSAAAEQERRFKYLVEDLAYRELSEGAAYLGIPEDAQRAFRLMRRGLDALLRSPILGWGAKEASKQLLAAATKPAVDLDLKAFSSPIAYLPPVVSLSDAYSNAATEWRRNLVPAAETGRYERLLSQGFAEIPDAPQPTLDEFQGKPLSEFVSGPEEDL